MALDLIAEPEAIIDSLADAGVEYAVCGGLALGILGHPRMTKDIDLLILPALGYDIPARRMVVRSGSETEQVMQRVSKLDPETNQLLPISVLLQQNDPCGLRRRSCYDESTRESATGSSRHRGASAGLG